MAAERKEKLIRVLQIMHTTDERSPLNANQIVERLSTQYELEDVDRRSIYRDMILLTDCGYNIKQCKDKRKGWYMEKHAFEDWEVKVMLDAVCQAKCISTDEASVIKDKLTGLLSERGRSRFSHLMMPKSKNYKDIQKIGEFIETMIEAMYLGKKIEFQYTELDNDLKRVKRWDGHYLKFNLYMIVWDNNNYYLIGNNDKYDNLAHYRLDRVDDIRISELDITKAEEKLGPNPELKIQEYIEQSVSQFSGDKVRITLEYEPCQSSNMIIHDFAGADPWVQHKKDGKVQISFVKLNSPTLIAWLLQNGSRFKVIKPESIKNQVLEELNKALESYNQ